MRYTLKAVSALGVAFTLLGTNRVYAEDLSLDAVKEHYEAVYTEYLEAHKAIYESQDYAYSYIKEFLEDKSWESLSRARAACRLAAANIRELELTESLSDEECTILAQNQIEYLHILADTADFESVRDEADELLSDNLFVKLTEYAFYNDYLELLGDMIDLDGNISDLYLQYLDGELEYSQLALEGSKNSKKMTELEKKYSGVLAEIEDFKSQQVQLNAKLKAFVELLTEKMQKSDDSWFSEHTVKFEDAPAWLPFPDWFFAEDYKYAFLVKQEDDTLNSLEYGDDLEQEMEDGLYIVYLMGDPVEESEIEDYVAWIDDMAKKTTREDNTWIINMDTYSIQISLTEDAMTMMFYGSDLSFSPVYFLNHI